MFRKRILMPLAMLLVLSVSFVFSSPKHNEEKHVVADIASVDVIEVYSQAMKRTIKNTVVLPANYSTAKDKALPVLYLLHGYDGDHKRWGEIRKTLAEDAIRWNMIIVCPDGKNSWYWNNPVDPALQYETYIAKELVNHIDQHYNTKPSRASRAIAGYSMGGYGALFLSIAHPDVFGACGSMSGGVDFRPFHKSWNLRQYLGEYDANKEAWNKRVIISQLDAMKKADLQIMIDCGVDDFFYSVNQELHQAMVAAKIRHYYISSPGGHTNTYWHDALDYQLMFFNKYFSRL